MYEFWASQSGGAPCVEELRERRLGIQLPTLKSISCNDIRASLLQEILFAIQARWLLP